MNLTEIFFSMNRKRQLWMKRKSSTFRKTRQVAGICIIHLQVCLFVFQDNAFSPSIKDLGGYENVIHNRSMEKKKNLLYH